MLELTAVQKSFGHFPVLDITHWQLDNGIYWLKGANGAGKSTLLRIIAGIIPFKGDIRLNGLSIRQQQVKYRSLINHAEAEPVFPSFLSGNELLSFVQDIKKGNSKQADEVKKILGIGEYLSNPCGSYSSGMLKKLSLLLAFSGQPDWIILDEPLTTLDTASQQALCELIMQWHREKGISFIITSHHDIGHEGIHFNKIFSLQDKRPIEFIGQS